MTIVGRVVGLREKAAWFEKRPLFGKTVLVTRTREQAGEFSAELAELGATVIEAPVIETRPPEHYGELDDAVRGGRHLDWIVFTSVNGVAGFFRRIDVLKLDVRSLHSTSWRPSGRRPRPPSTRRHLRVDCVPAQYVAEEVVEHAGRGADRRQELPAAGGHHAHSRMPSGLRTRRAHVTCVDVYRTVWPNALPKAASGGVGGGPHRLDHVHQFEHCFPFRAVGRPGIAGPSAAKLQVCLHRTHHHPHRPGAQHFHPRRGGQHTIPGLTAALVAAVQRATSPGADESHAPLAQ